MKNSPATGVQEVRIEPAGLQGLLGGCDGAKGLVIFAHGSGSSRLSPRNNHVAAGLRRASCATLLLDLLRPEEETERANVFNIPLLASRLLSAARWAARREETLHFPIGYFGASTGAAAALVAAASSEIEAAAVVSRGGRPDLAGPLLVNVTAPTLLIVGALDTQVIDLNRHAFGQIAGRKELAVVSGASHLFEEPGALDQVVGLAADWFTRYFLPAREIQKHGRGSSCRTR